MDTTETELCMKRNQPLSILKIDFDELYRRHLCRHGQFGLNVLHLISVYGVYFSVFALVVALIQLAFPGLSSAASAVAILALSGPYLCLLLLNIPVPVLLLTLLSVIVLTVSALAVISIPIWAHLLLIVFWHRFQIWSHRYYTEHRDMSEFETKYRKGIRLFTLLAVYELPILLHYLMAGGWRSERAEEFQF